MLDDFIEHDVRSRHGGRPIVVAHSLGCLIVRWLVCHNPVYAQKIQLVVAAGPPVLGSARAFRSVIKMPDLTLWANRLYGLMRLLRRSNADRREMALTKSLMTVLSVLELMPPRDVPVIDEGTGPRSAFEWRGWPEVLLKIVDLAEQTHQDIRSNPWPAPGPERQLIASDSDDKTEVGYLIDPKDPFHILGNLPVKLGDGTVLIESAREFGSDGKILLVKSHHERLLDDSETLLYFKNHF